MPSERDRDALDTIKQNVGAIRSFIDGMDFQTFASDLRTFYAVIRALEIISEATRRLSDDVKARHPNVSWRAIRDAADVYRHAYDRVAASLVWDTASGQLCGLLAAVIREFESSDSVQRRDEQDPR